MLVVDFADQEGGALCAWGPVVSSARAQGPRTTVRTAAVPQSRPGPTPGNISQKTRAEPVWSQQEPVWNLIIRPSLPGGSTAYFAPSVRCLQVHHFSAAGHMCVLYRGGFTGLAGPGMAAGRVVNGGVGGVQTGCAVQDY